MPYKVYVTSQVPREALDMLAKVARVEIWKEDNTLPHDTLLEIVKDIDGLYCLSADTVDAQLMDTASRLRVISNRAVGYDNIDIAYATSKGIPVGNTPGVLSETTADLAFALLMATARKVAQSDRYVRNGQWNSTWKPNLMMGQDIHHSTLGIIGMGRIGREMAKRGKGFDMRILYCNRHRLEKVEEELGAQYVSLSELLAESDFVSLHVPLSEVTRKLISRAELALMKPTSIIINTSRGAVVDQSALYEALKLGQIAGAGLDVLDQEPISPNDHLLTLDNVVFTPHIGSATVATRTRMAIIAAENLIAGLTGKELPHCVNPEVYRKS